MKFNFHVAALAHVIRHDFEEKKIIICPFKKKERNSSLFSISLAKVMFVYSRQKVYSHLMSINYKEETVLKKNMLSFVFSAKMMKKSLVVLMYMNVFFPSVVTCILYFFLNISLSSKISQDTVWFMHSSRG